MKQATINFQHNGKKYQAKQILSGANDRWDISERRDGYNQFLTATYVAPSWDLASKREMFKEVI